ncbi:acetyltransferase [Gillisia sp. M10.2A]|uniref:Acetyltransferase n=1 Tax=Gillisia lutea TaxID=2909668 RepID=A0ABS9EH45_9FLAO|nr:acetyltransferase [Gillisia lutea]MCF4102171.1 acetyltransferase [Gillisia lutea]
MAKKKLVIFPYNGNGIEALDCIDFDVYELIGFIDDDPHKTSGHYTIYSRDILQNHKDLFVLAVPGSPSSFHKREEIISSLGINISRYITAIHKNASIGKNVIIGRNCLIMAGVVLTSNARIGDHICVLPNSVIHHDSTVGNYTLIGSNVVVAGSSSIGHNCYIGSGTTIINNINVGDFSLVGLGSNILKDVPTHSRMVGNPARNLNSFSQQKMI